MRFSAAVRRLEQLPDPLPSPPVALIPVSTDAARPRPRWPEPPTTRESAVLVLLVPDACDGARVVLTERAARGGHHSGEVSFPGGAAESGDADLAATALREAHEEVGLDADAAGVRILGRLAPFTIPVSGFRITPIVAAAARPPELVPSEAEVARILLAPVDLFLPDARIELVDAVVREWPVRYGAYPVEGLRVWGATARILGQLGAVLGAPSTGP